MAEAASIDENLIKKAAMEAKKIIDKSSNRVNAAIAINDLIKEDIINKILNDIDKKP